MLDSWRTEVTRSCCAPDMPDVLPLAEPAEPAEPEAVEPEPAEPAAEPDVPADDESRRPRTSTFEFTYFSSSLFWPSISLYVEPAVLPVALLALPDVPAVEPPTVESLAVDPLVPEPPLDTVAFVNMNPLSVVELVATVVTARRAARVDAMVALRST